MINKIDLATQAEVKDVMAEIRSINKTAKVIRSVQSKVDINKILDIGCFDLKRIESQIDPEFAELVNEDNAAEKKEDHGHGHGHGKKEDHGHGHDGHGHAHGKGDCKEDHDHSKHRHNQRVSSIGFILPGEIDGEAMDEWWQELMKTQSKKIYRSKGILAMCASIDLFFNCLLIFYFLYFSPDLGLASLTGLAALPPLRKPAHSIFAFALCCDSRQPGLAADLVFWGPLWGVSRHGNPEKMVFQAVHEILDFQGLGLWKEGEKKENKMIFIGEDLDKKVLEDSFRMCLHKPDA